MCSFLYVTMVRFNRERHKCYFVPLFKTKQNKNNWKQTSWLNIKAH